MHKFQQVEAQIDTINSKGNGLGVFQRLDGNVVPLEVPFTLPGEKVLATLLKKKRGISYSRLDAVLEPSTDRIPPKCQHFGECGGCRWQHLPYEKQLKKKEERIRSLFPSCPMDPIVPSPAIWSYRNKMEFSFSSDASGERYLGLVKAGSYHVVNLNECHLVNPWFIEVLEATRNWWGRTQLRAFRGQTGTLRTLTVREGIQTKDRMVMLTITGEFEEHQSWMSAVKDAAGGDVSIYLREQRVAKGVPTQFIETLLCGEPYIREKLCGLTFCVSPTAFFQPNPLQAEKLITLGLQLAQIEQDQVVYDLYCGTGTLGICAAGKAKEVVGIEVCKEAVENAARNAKLNGVENYRAIAGTVKEILLKEELPRPDVVIVDPPRAGLEAETTAWLCAVRPQKILYISCNPLTQQKDAEVFTEAGYRIKAIQPVDQFPHTVHIENIILFER